MISAVLRVSPMTKCKVSSTSVVMGSFENFLVYLFRKAIICDEEEMKRRRWKQRLDETRLIGGSVPKL